MGTETVLALFVSGCVRLGKYLRPATARGWDQSERFDDAWALIAATYHAEITVFNNVIAIKPKPEPRARRAASR